MEISVEKSLACKAFELTHFVELSSPVPIHRIRVIWRDVQQGIEELVWAEIIGWSKDHGGSPCPAYAIRVRDPEGEEGVLVYGGNWGVRLQVREEKASEPVIWVALEEAAECFDPPIPQQLGIAEPM
jgi:hypothetical protein